MLTTIKQVSAIVLLIALACVCARVFVFVNRVEPKVIDLARNLDGAIGEVKRASTTGADYLAFQTELFQSTPYQKSVKASIDAPAIFNASGRYLNRFILPAMLKTVQTGNRTLETSNVAVEKLGGLVGDTNKSLNGDQGLLVAGTLLLRSMTTLSEKFGVTVADLDEAIKNAAAQANKSLEAVYALISDPHIVSMLTNFDQASASTATLMAVIAKAGESVPGIAQALEKISKESSKFARITLIANILGTLGRAFLP